MKPPSNRCYLCGSPAMWICRTCGQPICEEEMRLGVDAKGQKQYLCVPCDDRRQQHYTVARARG